MLAELTPVFMFRGGDSHSQRVSSQAGAGLGEAGVDPGAGLPCVWLAPDAP